MENNISRAKKELREKLKIQREEISDQEYDLSAKRMSGIDLAPLNITAETTVAVYYPIRRECNCLSLVETLRQRQIRIALPVIRGDDKSLLFREWLPETQLIKGELGIPALPESTRQIIPDILLIPLLAFDEKGGRLGYGKGHYDRTLAELRKNGRVNAVGVAFDTQEVPSVPCDEFDQRLDWILTPTGLRKVGV